MKKVSLFAGTLLALAPISALLPGCGGGNDGVVTPTSTASPTATRTSGPLPTETTTGTPGATPTRTARPTNTPIATSTPVATSTPIPIDAVKNTLTFTPSSDSNFKTMPVKYGRFNLRTSDGSNTLQFSAYGVPFNLEYVTIGGALLGAGEGNGYSANSQSDDPIQIQDNVIENGQSHVRIFDLKSGTITITKFSRSNATLSFNNAVFEARVGQGNIGDAKGTVTVNGTLSGPYTTNFVG